MKYRQNHEHVASDRSQSLQVRFESADPEAGSVFIAGTFNNSQPDAKPMHPVGNSRRVKETVLPPGTYEYCFVVDGQWMLDPLANDFVPNPFGGRNSILKVSSSPEAVHLAAAERLPLKNKTK
jgi:1,4-alpha-glucan branching enzyme